MKRGEVKKENEDPFVLHYKY